MAEDAAPVKSEAAEAKPPAAEPATPGRQKTPEASAPSDPSPPRLAPEAPTKTPKKDEDEEKVDGKPSPPDLPPTLVRASPQEQPQQRQQQPQNPPQAPPIQTPQAPPQARRGRPPGVPNRNTAAAQAAIAQQRNQQHHQQQQQQQNHQHQQQLAAAQIAAQMMHRNGHGQAMQMGPSMMQVNVDGQPQFVQIMRTGQPGQPQLMFHPAQAPRFPAQQHPPPIRPQPQPQQQQLLQPVLKPVQSGMSTGSTNTIPIPPNQLIQRPDGTYSVRPEFIHQMQQMAANQGGGLQMIVNNGQGSTVRQASLVSNRKLQLTPSQQKMVMQQLQASGRAVPPHGLILQQQQQQRPPQELQHAQQHPQPQGQLTRQNLPPQDRLASGGGAAANGSSSSRTSDWVGGLPVPPQNGPQHMPQLQQPANGQPQGGIIDLDDEEQEAAPQLAAETEPILNVESLNAEEAFQQESQPPGRRKKTEKNNKVIAHDIGGYKIIETAEPTNSAHLEVDDFEPIIDDDSDASDKSYEGKDDEVPARRPLNGAGLGDQVEEWMQRRLEMDIPRDERRERKEAEGPQKPSTRADGRKKGKHKSNELKSLLQMDFGPKENTNRAKEVIMIVKNVLEENNARTPGESAKNVRNKELRSNSAASGSIAPKGKEKRARRNRDSKECRACGKNLAEKKTDKQYPGYCNERCYRISDSPSPSNSEDEDDEHSSTMTPEPTSRKKESPTVAPSSSGKRAATKEIKEEPLEENEKPSSTPVTRRRGGRQPKKEETETPPVIKKEVATPKKEDKKETKKEIKKETPVKEEKMEEDEEKQKSPAAAVGASKRRSTAAVVDKKEGPEAKARKVEPPATAAAAAPAAPTVAAAHPTIAAALTAPSVNAATLPPPPQPQRLPEAVVAPSPAVSAAPAPPQVVVAATAAAPAAPALDSIGCRQMSVDQVRQWVEQITGKPEVGEKFSSEDIDGEALLKIKYEDLRNDLQLSLGMARKVHSAIEEIINRRPTGSDE